MPKLILYIAQSLDGYIADEKGSVSWLSSFQHLGSDFGYDAFFADVGVLMMGANTYAHVLEMGEWPYGDKPVLVCTNRQLTKVAENVLFVTGDFEDILEEARMLCPEGKHIWLVGGGDMVRQAVVTGKLDLMMLFTMPVLLGSGIKLFAPETTTKDVTWTTVLAQQHVGGVIEARYRAVIPGDEDKSAVSSRGK